MQIFTNKKINKSCNIHVCVKKPGALTKTTDCHPMSQWIKSISNHVYWCVASTEPSPDRGEVVLAKWQSVANHVQNIHEQAQPSHAVSMQTYPKTKLATTGWILVTYHDTFRIINATFHIRSWFLWEIGNFNIFLLAENTYLCGTTRAHRRDYPNKLASAKLKPGESIKQTNDDNVMLVKWLDMRDVYMIATNDEGLDVVRQVRRNNMPCDMPTPCCVRKYNSLMGGVDRMDQLPSYNSLGRAGRRWWKYNSLMGGVDRMDQLRSYYSVGHAGRRWWKYNSLMGGVDRMDQLPSYNSVGRAGRRWWKYNSLMGGVDRMDQLRSYYSVGRAGRRWWKYIFWGLLNIWHHQRLHSLEEDEPPPPCQQSCLLTEDMEDEADPQHGWRLRVTTSTALWNGGRQSECRAGLCRQHSPGTPASPVLGPKENMKTMYPHSLSL